MGNPHPERSRRGIQFFFKVLRYWMPDQVRHDRQRLSTFLNPDTVWKAGILRFQIVLDTCSLIGVRDKLRRA
jgi:hypothetical protein